MEWITLVLAVVLLLAGIIGQRRIPQKSNTMQSGDRSALRRVIVVGSMVIGAWLCIIAVSQLLHVNMVKH